MKVVDEEKSGEKEEVKCGGRWKKCRGRWKK
jgi:hypothetical protein